jgi:hypothetical protein
MNNIEKNILLISNRIIQDIKKPWFNLYNVVYTDLNRIVLIIEKNDMFVGKEINLWSRIYAYTNKPTVIIKNQYWVLQKEKYFFRLISTFSTPEIIQLTKNNPIDYFTPIKIQGYE